MEDLAQNPFCAKSNIYYILDMWRWTGIDCFVLITGYFMCKSHITLRKYLKLLLEVIYTLFQKNILWSSKKLYSLQSLNINYGK